jgi:hypothetical protein
VNLYDNIGVQADGAAWGFEAEWTAGGARCVTALTDTRVRQRWGVKPSCFGTKVSVTCGLQSNWSLGTKLMTEVP